MDDEDRWRGLGYDGQPRVAGFFGPREPDLRDMDEEAEMERWWAEVAGSAPA